MDSKGKIVQLDDVRKGKNKKENKPKILPKSASTQQPIFSISVFIRRINNAFSQPFAEGYNYYLEATALLGKKKPFNFRAYAKQAADAAFILHSLRLLASEKQASLVFLVFRNVTGEPDSNFDLPLYL